MKKKTKSKRSKKHGKASHGSTSRKKKSRKVSREKESLLKKKALCDSTLDNTAQQPKLVADEYSEIFEENSEESPILEDYNGMPLRVNALMNENHVIAKTPMVAKRMQLKHQQQPNYGANKLDTGDNEASDPFKEVEEKVRHYEFKEDGKGKAQTIRQLRVYDALNELVTDESEDIEGVLSFLRHVNTQICELTGQKLKKEKQVVKKQLSEQSSQIKKQQELITQQNSFIKQLRHLNLHFQQPQSIQQLFSKDPCINMTAYDVLKAKKPVLVDKIQETRSDIPTPPLKPRSTPRQVLKSKRKKSIPRKLVAQQQVVFSTPFDEDPLIIDNGIGNMYKQMEQPRVIFHTPIQQRKQRPSSARPRRRLK